MAVKILLLFLSFHVSCLLCANVEVALTPSDESTADKSIVTLTAKNSFSQPVDSAKVWVFALDEAGAVVGQKSAWIISKKHSASGDTSSLAGLDAGETAEITMSIDTERGATSTKVTFTKIILADGSLVNPHKQVIPYEK